MTRTVRRHARLTQGSFDPGPCGLTRQLGAVHRPRRAVPQAARAADGDHDNANGQAADRRAQPRQGRGGGPDQPDDRHSTQADGSDPPFKPLSQNGTAAPWLWPEATAPGCSTSLRTRLPPTSRRTVSARPRKSRSPTSLPCHTPTSLARSSTSAAGRQLPEHSTEDPHHA